MVVAALLKLLIVPVVEVLVDLEQERDWLLQPERITRLLLGPVAQGELLAVFQHLMMEVLALVQYFQQLRLTAAVVGVVELL